MNQLHPSRHHKRAVGGVFGMHVGVGRKSSLESRATTPPAGEQPKMMLTLQLKCLQSSPVLVHVCSVQTELMILIDLTVCSFSFKGIFYSEVELTSLKIFEKKKSLKMFTFWKILLEKKMMESVTCVCVFFNCSNSITDTD